MTGPDAPPTQLVANKPHPDKTPARSAMPSGAVRARRVHPRHRKPKARAEQQLEPAAPNPADLKTPANASPRPRSADTSIRSQSKPCPSNSEDNSNLLSPAPQQPQSQGTQPSQQHPSATQAQVIPSSVPHQSHALPASHPSATHPLLHSPSHQHIQQHMHHVSPPGYVHFQNAHQQHPPHLPHIMSQPQPIHQEVLHLAPVAQTHLIPTQALMHVPVQPQQHQHSAPQLLNQSTQSPPSLNTSQQLQGSANLHHASPPSSTPVQAKPEHLVQTGNEALDCVVHAPGSPVDAPASGGRTLEDQASSQETSAASVKPAATGPNEEETDEFDKISQVVSAIKSPLNGRRARPLICQDITNSNADTLRISRLPRGVTYDRLLSMVEPFGEVEDLAWSSSDPYVCDVTYRDAAAAHEAKHFLGDALVGSDSEPPLKAELRSRDPGAQLFVGDLTPDVTEEMLEAVFSELVGEPVTALLKRDPDSFSPIGYGFLSFKSESSANFALVAGHRVKVGNACVRVGRAERNTYLYVSDLAPDVSMDELRGLFGRFGSLVDEDTVIVRRSYAFIRYKNRNSAEKAKRTLDKTDLKGSLTVRYAEAEPLKACVAVQFHSSVPRPPNSLRDLLSATFSKYGNCSVEIPRLTHGMWRKVAFVTFHGEPVAANLAALEAVQSVRFVSSLPVCCQFARELIPRLPSRGMSHEKHGGALSQKGETLSSGQRLPARNFLARRHAARRAGQASTGVANANRSQPLVDNRSQHTENETSAQQGNPDFVPVYVPITALQHSNQQMSPSQNPGSDNGFSGYQWSNRMMIPTRRAPPRAMHHPARPVNYESFAGMQDRAMHW